MSKSKKKKKKSRKYKKVSNDTFQIVQIDKEYLENLKKEELEEKKSDKENLKKEKLEEEELSRESLKEDVLEKESLGDEVSREKDSITYEFTNELYVKTKKYNFIEPFIVIFSLVICFFLLYKFIIVSKRTVVSSLFNNVTNNMLRIVDDVSEVDFSKDSFNSDIELSFTTTNADFQNLMNYKYFLSTEYDSENNIISGVLNIKTLNNQDITSLVYKSVDNKLYLSNSDLFYYPVSFEFNSLLSRNIDYQLLKDNLINIKNVIMDNLTYENSTKKESKIVIDDSEVAVDDLEIFYDNKELNKIVNDIVDDIESDANLLESIASLLGLSKEDLEEKLSSLRSINREIKLNIYTKGIFAEVIGFKLTIDNVELASMYNYGGKDIYTLLYRNNPLEFIADKNNNIFNLKYAGVSLLEVSNYVKTAEGINFNYSLNSIVDKYLGTFKLTNISDNESNLNISFSSTNNRNINADINFAIVTSDFTDNLNIDISDSINFKDLSEEEILDIWNNFLEKLEEPIIIN